MNDTIPCKVCGSPTLPGHEEDLCNRCYEKQEEQEAKLEQKAGPSKEQAIAMIRTMAREAVRCFEVVNGERRGTVEAASNRENKAANELLKAMGHHPLPAKEWDNLLG